MYGCNLERVYSEWINELFFLNIIWAILQLCHDDNKFPCDDNEGDSESVKKTNKISNSTFEGVQKSLRKTIRSCKSKKDIQLSGQKQTHKRTNNCSTKQYIEKKDRAARNPLRTYSDLECFAVPVPHVVNRMTDNKFQMAEKTKKITDMGLMNCHTVVYGVCQPRYIFDGILYYII